MATGAYAARSIKKLRFLPTGSIHFIESTLLIGLLLFCLRSVGECATKEDLRNEITTLSLAVDRDISQDVEVINAILTVLAPPQSVTVGTVEGRHGTSANIPVYLKASTAPIAGVQFDVTNVPGLTVTSVLPGLAAQASGKSVSGNQTPGAFRIILFGLNQTAIPSGPIVILKVAIGTSVVPGKKVIPIAALSATSPAGTTVILTGRAGSLSVK